MNPESPFQMLQLAGAPDVCFPVTDPAPFFPYCQITPTPPQVANLGLSDPAKAAHMVIGPAIDGLLRQLLGAGR